MIKSIEEQLQEAHVRIAQLEAMNQFLQRELPLETWVRMYNKRDKDCFEAELKLARAEEKLSKIAILCTPSSDSRITMEDLLECNPVSLPEESKLHQTILKIIFDKS